MDASNDHSFQSISNYFTRTQTRPTPFTNDGQMRHLRAEIAVVDYKQGTVCFTPGCDIHDARYFYVNNTSRVWRTQWTWHLGISHPGDFYTTQWDVWYISPGCFIHEDRLQCVKHTSTTCYKPANSSNRSCLGSALV